MNMEISEHCNKVSGFAVDIAREMGLCPFYINQIGLAAQYHDIGKDYIPKSIIDKPHKLTEEEQMIMRTHTSIGFWLLRKSITDPSNILAEVALNHHENFDGSGYYGKCNHEISIASRITRVADVFSALSEDRVYRPPWEIKDAVYYIARNSGTLFDPLAVQAFIKIIAKSTEKATKAVKGVYGWN